MKLFYTDINQTRLDREYIIALKLDIHAVYDSIWGEGIIYKMAQLGTTGRTALWISKWIGIRKIKVKWRDVSSRTIGSYLGVPQGSVLSPILFMICLWDLFETVDSGVHIMVYADDILLYVSPLYLVTAIMKMQDILNRIKSWCSHWKLELWPDKCAAIIFSRHKDAPLQNLTLDG